VGFAAITFCVASQRAFIIVIVIIIIIIIIIVYFIMTQSGNFWIYPRARARVWKDTNAGDTRQIAGNYSSNPCNRSWWWLW
jgi:hypothetical protein